VSDLSSSSPRASLPGADPVITDGGTEVLSRSAFEAAKAASFAFAPTDALPATPPRLPPPPLDDLFLDDFGDATRLDLDPPFAEQFAAASVESPIPPSARGLTTDPSPVSATATWAEADARSTSIAPLAFDVAPSPSSPDATLKYPAYAHRASPSVAPPVAVARSSRAVTILAATISAGVALSVGILATALVLKGTPSSSTATRGVAVAAPRSAVIVPPQASPSQTEPGATASDNSLSASAAPAADEEPKEPKKKKRKTAPLTSAWLDAPEPTPEPLPPAAAEPPRPPPAPVVALRDQTTGILEVPTSLKTVMIDGDYRRAGAGRVVVTCGRHKVNAGRGTHTVDVPCGGSVSVL
jgi:hypothetical protein